MVKHNEPYLGVKTLDEKEEQKYVVLFTDDNYGTIVYSTITDNPKLKFGVTGDFDEETFEFLPPEQGIRISN